MTPEEMQRRIRDAVKAVDEMSDETIRLAVCAGLLDRSHPRYKMLQGRQYGCSSATDCELP